MKMEARPMGSFLGNLMKSGIPVYDLSKEEKELEVTVEDETI